MWHVAVLVAILTARRCEGVQHKVTEEVWLDIQIEDYHGWNKPYTERIHIALFGETVPITVYNFVSLIKGFEKDSTYMSYQGSPVHRVMPDLLVQMGDVVGKDGSSGTSIYSDTFDDENFTLRHSGPGMVAMANTGKDTNGSQFYITLQVAPWLNRKHVVFGRVTQGLEFIQLISQLPTRSNTDIPGYNIIIEDCGIIELSEPYTLDQMEY